MAGGARARAVLAPAGHPAVDEGGLPGEAVVGPDTESLGDTGSHALEQQVGAGDEVEHPAYVVGGP